MDGRNLCGVLLLSAMALAGCVTPPDADTNADVTVHAVPMPGGEGLLNVQVQNRSDEERCVPTEVVQRPRSEATFVRFWYRGRPVPPPSDGGYILPQLPGFHHIPPRGSLALQVDIRGRFIADTVSTGDVIDVSVGISHWRCSALGAYLDDVSWSRKISMRYVSP